ncbi:MAG: hypothetical protein ACKO9Z_06115 [Planctomycetota bacterium]|nr:hypothetical protein [Planctomycetota bacterium]
MTWLGKMIVVCHTLLCLMFATAGVVLNSTRPPYADQAKQKAEEVAFMRKSLRLDDSFSRLIRVRVAMASLENDWILAEKVYAEREKEVVEATLPNTIGEVDRDPNTSLPLPDPTQRFVPMFKKINLLGQKTYKEKMIPDAGLAVENAQKEFQERKKEAIAMTEKASGTDGKGGVTSDIIIEDEKIEQMKVERNVYEADVAITTQDIDRMKARLARVLAYLQNLEKYLQVPSLTN